MKPITFPEKNKTYTKPPSMTDKECGSLDVFENEQVKISCWEFTPAERLHAIFTNKIWLHVWMNVQPPVLLSAEFPFVQEKSEPIETIVDRMIERKVKQFLLRHGYSSDYLREQMSYDDLSEMLADYSKFFFEIDSE